MKLLAEKKKKKILSLITWYPLLNKINTMISKVIVVLWLNHSKLILIVEQDIVFIKNVYFF